VADTVQQTMWKYQQNSSHDPTHFRSLLRSRQRWVL